MGDAPVRHPRILAPSDRRHVSREEGHMLEWLTIMAGFVVLHAYGL
jgi:hypothetical protein